jgi:hypothetical protein
MATKNKAPNIRILTIRDQKVVLDVDLARVYGVTTERLNEQFRRNRKRFPKDFAFQLTTQEDDIMRSRTVTASADPIMWSQIATTSPKRRRKIHRPWAFTEHGALQAANILLSDRTPPRAQASPLPGGRHAEVSSAKRSRPADWLFIC